MKFNTVAFNYENVEFKKDLNDIEIIGIEVIAKKVLKFKDQFSYTSSGDNGAMHNYHASEFEKYKGLNIEGFKMSVNEQLYLVCSDEEENYTLFRFEQN